MLNPCMEAAVAPSEEFHYSRLGCCQSAQLKAREETCKKRKRKIDIVFQIEDSKVVPIYQISQGLSTTEPSHFTDSREQAQQPSIG